MEIPEIHEAERMTLEPGDILVVHNSEIEIDMQFAREIERAVRAHLERPDLKVMVLGRDWQIAVIRDEQVRATVTEQPSWMPAPGTVITGSPWRPWEHDIPPNARVEDSFPDTLGESGPPA